MSYIDNKFFNFDDLFFEKKPLSVRDIETRITSIFNELESRPPTLTEKDLSNKFLVNLLKKDAARVASKVEGLAKAVGITTAHVTLLTYMKGKDLGDSLSPEVRALAAKDIPMPLPFDAEAFERAKEEMRAVLVEPLEKVVFQKVTSALRRLTFDDLISGLRAIIPSFNEAIGSEPFTAVTAKGKSNEWVTQIALREGLRPPDKISLRIDELDADTPVHHEAVVLIDDASYSGKQISLFMRNICEASKIVRAYQPKPVTKFFVLVPFITEKARETILKAGEKNGVEVHIMASGAMPTLPEVLNEEEAHCFKKMAFEADQPISRVPTLAFTDWSRPDMLSVPTAFLEGKVYYTAADGTTKFYKGAPLVPDIDSPYKIMSKSEHENIIMPNEDSLL